MTKTNENEGELVVSMQYHLPLNPGALRIEKRSTGLSRKLMPYSLHPQRQEKRVYNDANTVWDQMKNQWVEVEFI